MTASAAELYRERRLGQQQARITRPALVIVDLTYGFTEPDSNLGCDADEAVAHTAELLSVARARNVPRVFTRIEYDASTAAIAAPFLEKMPALRECVTGTHWAQVDERIAPAHGEPVLSKLFASGFFGTNLSSFLAGYGCDGLVVTGATTSGCVRATVVDALQYGYRVLVPRTAVTDRATEPHDAALFDIDAKYGQVTALAEAKTVLSTDERKVEV